jgi:hypothetical protein
VPRSAAKESLEGSTSPIRGEDEKAKEKVRESAADSENSAREVG